MVERRRHHQDQFQSRLQDCRPGRTVSLGTLILDKLKSLPMLRDVDRPAGRGMTATLTIDRDQAARFGVQPQ